MELCLESEDDALDILKEIKAGGDFMELAKGHSYTVKAPNKVAT